MPTKTMPDRATLNSAADLLQRTHDIIEAVGFDIDHFGDLTSQDVGEEGPAPMCHIGTVRYAAGLTPSPGKGVGPACAGDGPELIVALKVLDGIAKRRMDSDRRQEVRNEWTEEAHFHKDYHSLDFDPDYWMTGRFVEAFGFQIQERANDRYPDDPEAADRYQRDYALKLLRAALTEIYK